MPEGRATPRIYRELLLELRDLDDAGESCVVTVLPTGGAESEPTNVALRMKELRTPLRKIADKTISFEQLCSLGEKLGNRLLPEGIIRSLYREALNNAGRDGGVRIRLLIRDSRLAQIPWEFTYVQRVGTERDASNFLLLNPQLSMVRHEVLPFAPGGVVPADPSRLRVVAAIADVTGAEINGIGEVEFDELDLSAERELVDELKKIRVDGVTVDLERTLDGATADALAKALLKPADVFHFGGHGYFLTKEEEPEVPAESLGGYVVVQGATAGRGVALSADRLATLLQGAGVRLAILAACESARRDDGSPWSAIAPALVRRGLPAAVAMQYDVVDEQAKEFTRMLYTALASGLSIDEAVAVGRQTLLDTDGGRGMEWGVPVLYMRAADGSLFPDIAARETKSGAEIRRHIEQVVDTIEKGGSMIGIRAETLPDGSFTIVQRAKTTRGDMIGLDLKRTSTQ